MRAVRCFCAPDVSGEGIWATLIVSSLKVLWKMPAFSRSVCREGVCCGGGRVFSLGGCDDDANEWWVWVSSGNSIVEASLVNLEMRADFGGA